MKIYTSRNLPPQHIEGIIGYIPDFLDEDDMRPAKKQFDENYFGGWVPMDGFKMDDDGTLHYPGDPPLRPLVIIKFKNEVIRIYQASFVSIQQEDGSWEVARMD